jgi:putative NADH-flavin reductase
MKLAIFGATGAVGAELRAQALAAGHDVRALVRTPSKLGKEHRQLTVVEGNAKDAAAVKQTVLGCEAVLSTLGASSKDDPDTRRSGTANIMAAMCEAGIRRLVVMGGFHIHCPGDPGNLGQKLITPLLRLSRNLVEDTTAMGALVLASDLDWTLVRAPRVVHRQRNGAYRTGMLKLGPWSSVTRADVASFMLRCLTDDSCIRQAPMISR